MLAQIAVAGIATSTPTLIKKHNTCSWTINTVHLSESNSLVAKFAFLILVIFAFVILLRVGISTISYFLTPTSSPHLIDGMVDAKQLIVFPQDPSSNGAVTIYRSVNSSGGIEFSWSVWIFINSMQYLEILVFHNEHSPIQVLPFVPKL